MTFNLGDVLGHIPEDKKLHRTLVRVVRDEGDRLLVCVPGWNPKTNVRVEKKNLTKEIRLCARRDFRFFCQVNVGAPSDKDLRFKPPFEIAPEPDPKDGLR